MEFEDYMTCGVYSVNQVFNQQFKRPGEEREEEVAEGKMTFVEDSISVMCNRLEN